MEHRRGDTLKLRFSLLEVVNADRDFIAADFAQIWFTVRKKAPKNAVVDDVDADVVAQVTLTGGGITFEDDDTTGWVKVEEDVTDLWIPGKTYFYDLQAKTAGSSSDIFTFDAGEITVEPDYTRSR